MLILLSLDSQRLDEEDAELMKMKQQKATAAGETCELLSHFTACFIHVDCECCSVIVTVTVTVTFTVTVTISVSLSNVLIASITGLLLF